MNEMNERIDALIDDCADMTAGIGYAARRIIIRTTVEACFEAVQHELEIDQWFPVSERLPDELQPVVLVNVNRWENTGVELSRNVHACGFLSDACKPNPPFWSIRGERAQMLEAFTHWMPLPATPAIHAEVNP